VDLATTIAKNSLEFSPFSSNVVPMIHTPFMIFENIFMISEKNIKFFSKKFN
jgi:hypothetical protein